MSNLIGSASPARATLDSPRKSPPRHQTEIKEKMSRVRGSAEGNTLSGDAHYTEAEAQKATPSSNAFAAPSAMRERALLDVRDALNVAMQIAKPVMMSPKKDFRQLGRSCSDLCLKLTAALDVAVKSDLGDSHADLIWQLRQAPNGLKAAISAKDVSGYVNVMLELTNALPPQLLQPKKVDFSPRVEVVAPPGAASLSEMRLMKAVTLAQQDVHRFQSVDLKGDEAWSAQPRQKLPSTLKDSSRLLAKRLKAAAKALATSRPELSRRLKSAYRDGNPSSLQALAAKGDLKGYAASLGKLAKHIEKALDQTG